MKFDYLKTLKQLRGIVEVKLASLSDEQRKKFVGYSYIILTLITLSFFGIFAIAPTLSTIAGLNRQLKDSELVRDALNEKLTNLQVLDFQYSEIQSDIPIIYSAIPRTPEIPKLTRQLENLAEDNNVTITRLNFGNIEIYPNSRRNQIYSFNFSISATGTQNTINSFIGELISFDRIIGIERAITGIDQNDQYAATITGIAYFSDK